MDTRLLDEILVALSWPASYATSHSTVEQDSCGPDFASYATSCSAVERVSCSTATRKGLGWDLEELSSL